MLGWNLLFIIVVPVSVVSISAALSKPGFATYGIGDDEIRAEGLEKDVIVDYLKERYRWLADVGLNLQLTGLATLIAAILDRQLYTNMSGFGFLAVYVLPMMLGFGFYREGKYADRVRPIWKNITFDVGLILVITVETVVFLSYV